MHGDERDDYGDYEDELSPFPDQPSWETSLVLAVIFSLAIIVFVLIVEK